MEDYPNLRHLRLLEAAVRLGALTRAAEVLHLSQPAATQAMARLSRLYGVELLARRGNGVTATPAGEIVAARTLRVLALIAELGRRSAPGPGRPLPSRVVAQATLAGLRALAAVAEAGSFTAAAGLLGQTEPSVQRAARGLERAAGAAFFAGGRGGLSLTAEGRRAAERAGLALREIELSADEVNEARGRIEGRLMIGALPLLRTAILPAAVVALAARRPAARIEVLDGSYEDLVARLRTGRADLVLGALRGTGHGLSEEVLFHDRLSVIARTGHPLAGTAPDLQRLFDFPWVLSRRGTPNRAVFERLAAAAGRDPGPGGIETGSLVALRGILLASDRLALLSPRQVLHELRTGLLCDLGAALPDAERPIGITRLSAARSTRLQEEFLALLREAAGTA